VGAFVGLEAAPFETVDDIFFCPGHEAGLVGIFDPKDELAAMLAGEQVVVEYGPYTAEVKAPGGAGGKSQPYFFAHRPRRYEPYTKSLALTLQP
jgi:hypothetical protein